MNNALLRLALISAVLPLGCGTDGLESFTGGGLDDDAGPGDDGIGPPGGTGGTGSDHGSLTGLADDLQEAPAPQKPAAPAAKKTDVKAKAKAANQQPPQLGGNANKSEKAYDINQMSEDEFDALPAATKARLRGDIF